MVYLSLCANYNMVATVEFLVNGDKYEICRTTTRAGITF